jgi:autotransporter family porin
MRWTLICLSVAVFAGFALSSSVTAQTNSWTGTSDGSWQDGGNWSLGVAPDTAQSALITNEGSKTVIIDSTTSSTFSNSMTVSNLTVSGTVAATNIFFLSNSGTNIPLRIHDSLTIAGGGSLRMTNTVVLLEGLVDGALTLEGSATLFDSQLLLSNNVALTVGTTNGGLLSNAGGTNVISGDVYVGFPTNSTGTSCIVGGLLLQTSGYTIIGYYGSGQLVMSNGAFQVSVTNLIPGAVFLGLKSGANGGLGIPTGNSIALDHLSLGEETGTTGLVWVTGGQLIATNQCLATIGGNGVGQLVVSNGQFSGTHALVGAGPGSVGTLVLNGGTTTLSGGLAVGGGQGATGLVSITGGQLTVTNQNMDVFVGNFGFGQMVLSSGVLLARNMVVGNYSYIIATNNPLGAIAQGVFTVAGGVASVSSNLVAGAFTNANGVIQVTGGALTVTNASAMGQLVVGQIGQGTFAQDAGVVTVDQLSVINGTNSVFLLNSGTFNTGSTTVSNARTLVIGNGSDVATFHLLGGVHTFTDGARIRSNAFLTGCGTINGNLLVDAGGRVVADCGGTLTFTGAVTNNGVLRALNGSVLKSLAPVVNNGVIDVLGGSTNFLSGFVNNGSVITTDSIPEIVSIAVAPVSNVAVAFTTGNSAPYVVESTTNLAGNSWTPLTNFSGTGGVMSVIDPDAASLPQKFYRVHLVVPP